MSKRARKLNRSRYILTRWDMLEVLAVTPQLLSRMIRKGQVPPPASFSDSDSQQRKGTLQRWSRQDILAWLWCGMPPAADWVDLKARFRADMLAAGVAPPWGPEGTDLQDSDLPADSVVLEEYLGRISDAVVDQALKRIELVLIDKGVLEPEPEPPDPGDEDVSLMPTTLPLDPVTGDIQC